VPTSDRKLKSARANGAKSRGPKTDAGKRASSLNALKHGLTAQTVVLPHESEDEYNADLAAYLDHFQPASKPEEDLVAQLASVQWRIIRYAGVEAALLQKSIVDRALKLDEQYDTVDDYTRVAVAFEALCRDHGPLSLLNRYQARLHHEYQRILKAIERIQAARNSDKAKLRNEPSPISEQSPAKGPGMELDVPNPTIHSPQHSTAATLPGFMDRACAPATHHPRFDVSS
jgi:hypothetical protein